MPLVLTEEQQMLRDSARDFLTERAPVAHLRELRDSGEEAGFSRSLWAEMAELGWAAMLVPEAYGGLDYGFTGMGVVLEECGRTLTPSPLLATAMTGVAALKLAGTEAQCADLMAGIASGEHLLALACDESSRHLPQVQATQVEDLGGQYRISGRKLAVVDGHVADTFIVSAWTGGGISLFLVPSSAKGLEIERYPVLDTHAAAEITLDQVVVDEKALLGVADRGDELLDRILDTARIGISAELLGVAREAFERTVDYLRERKQFGVPIGSFQALQHRAASLYAELEMSQSVVLKALQKLDAGDQDIREIASLAKAKLGETAHRATTEAIQMHGGIGMTDEFDIGFFLKRSRILEALYGDRYYHLDRYARLRGY
jgi:alkylation response protein AidB-like acyl-CoA dehydrogenase